MSRKPISSPIYAAKVAKTGHEKIKAQKRQSYMRHKDAHKAKVYAYRAVDKERWLLANREYQRKRAQADPGYWRKKSIQKEYGITFEQYEAMVKAQDGKCLICENDFPVDKNGRRQTHIDHCHETGRVRGVLCVLCNVMLGSARENITILETAVRYLRSHQERTAKGA